MATRKHAGADQNRDEAVLQDLWLWCGDADQLGPYGVRITLGPTQRKGVWKVVAAAHHMVEGHAKGAVAQVAGEYPNADSVTLAYYLYRLMMRLDTLASSEFMRSETDA